ncbi:MAG TPA: hypothetical protein DEQ34_08725 [Balneolaceae bacterium]|nr:hypothetical protein [Balneolaceae bacterium]
MKISITLSISIVTLLAVLVFLPKHIFTQGEESDLRAGAWIANVNLSYTGAERDLSNFELEKSFKRINTSLQTTYFLTNTIGLGFEAGTSNLVQTFDDTNNWYEDKDEFQNVIHEFKYGFYPAYFISIPSLPDNYKTYIEAGVFQIRSRYRFEGSGTIVDYNNGYRIGAGLMIPLAKKVFLNAKLTRDSFKAETLYGEQVGNTTEYKTITRWPASTRLGLGISFKF